MSTDNRINDLLSKMTLEEKVAQLCGTIFPWGNFPVKFDGDKLIKDEHYAAKTKHGLGGVAYVNMSIGPADSVRYTNALQKDIIENTRLGIPLLIFEECCHGQLAQGATMFPMPPALAATFDEKVVEEVFDVVGRESRTRGGNMAFTPVMDIARDPRWGRAEETFGEDTFLAGKMGAAAVRGLQGGKSLRPTHIASAPKHFAGFGQSQGGRQLGPSELGERYFRDEILESFRIAIQEGNAEGLMPSYTEVDGVPCHANRHILTDILRDEWNFDGVVTSDFGGVGDLLSRYKVVNSREGAAAKALHAGVDMDLPDGDIYESLIAAARGNTELLERIERSVRRVLALKFRLGLFDQPYTDENAALATVNNDHAKDVALRAAERGIVLLKNENNLLPLDEKKLRKVAVIGPHGRLLWFGGVSAHNNGVNIVDGLKARLPNADVQFAQGCALTDRDENLAYLQETADQDFTTLRSDAFSGDKKRAQRTDRPQLVPLEKERKIINDAAELARQSDVAIVCVGDSGQCCGENYAPNRYGDRDTLELIGNQLELIKAVKATGTPVVLVVVHTRALAIGDPLALADAVLDIWNIGQERGRAVAKVLMGDVNPGGKLPVTLPVHVGQIPCHYSQKRTAHLRDYAFSDERYLFPFGFGLSYTTFEIKDLKLSSPSVRLGEAATAEVTVTNSGARTGDETVQLYISDDAASVSRPALLLRGFQRVTLQPGESRTLRFAITPELLRFHNDEMREVVEPGTFTVSVGADSHDRIGATLTVQ